MDKAIYRSVLAQSVTPQSEADRLGELLGDAAESLQILFRDIDHDNVAPRLSAHLRDSRSH